MPSIMPIVCGVLMEVMAFLGTITVVVGFIVGIITLLDKDPR